MEIRHTYLFKSPDDGRILGYFVPMRGRAVSVAHIMSVLARSHSTMRRFQIGVKTETEHKQNIRWNDKIYTVYNDGEKIPFDDKNIIPLNKQFEFVYPARMPTVEMIQTVSDSNLIIQ